MNEIEFTTIYNNTFKMIGATKEDYISTMAAGYIIRPDGLIVIVPDSSDHADISSQYIYQYLETEYKYFQSTEAIQILTKEPFNCVVYNGVKVQDSKEIYGKENRYCSSNAQGYGILFLPLETEMSEEQKEICQKLLASNKSLFGNYDKIDLTIGLITGEEIDRLEFEEKLKRNSKNM
ncbi:MAG: hypothetical protein HFI09_04395 [Bacilli bacterium]|nr:hypothetical protein [Bacilli bacterium]